MKIFLFLLILLLSSNANANGLNVYGLGIYDIKFDGSQTNEAIDFRYERRFDYSLIQIDPETYDFFNLKPFAGIEFTSDQAYYVLGGIYLEDNIGTLFKGDSSRYNLTPSIGVGLYDDGDGKKLGNTIEFRSTLEISYELENKDRIGFSFGHISNANIGDKNPGVEILNFSYQFPYN